MVNGRRMIGKSSVLAAMFDTYNIDEAAARQFWSMVRDGTGTGPQAPDRVLREIIISSTNKLNSPSRRRELYWKCLRAWNAWRAGKEIKIIRLGSEQPVAL